MTSVSRVSFFLATILLLSGCGLYWNQLGSELHLYDGPREAHEVATIDQGLGCSDCVQTIWRFDQDDPVYVISPPRYRPAGSQFDRPNKFIVLPGKYLVTLSFTNAAGSTGYVDLQPGHTYEVLNRIFTGFTSTKTFVWMEDAETGEVVLGSKKDHVVEDPYAGQENPDRFSIIRAEREAEWCRNGLTEYCK